MRIGTPELLLILVIALFVFGPQKLPEMAKTLGQTLGGFKKELAGYEEDASEIKDALKFDTTTTKKSTKKKKKKSTKKTASSEKSETEESSEPAEESAEPAESSDVSETEEPAEAAGSETSEEA